MMDAEAKRLPGDLYQISLKFRVGKSYADSLGEQHPAAAVNDYIDIGVFGAPTKTRDGRTETRPLFLKKYRLTAGEHRLELTVRGKPDHAGIDPFAKLIDLEPWEREKMVEIVTPPSSMHKK
jgi:ABC-2 type transport system permease protein